MLSTTEGNCHKQSVFGDFLLSKKGVTRDCKECLNKLLKSGQWCHHTTLQADADFNGANMSTQCGSFRNPKELYASLVFPAMEKTMEETVICVLICVSFLLFAYVNCEPLLSLMQ